MQYVRLRNLSLKLRDRANRRQLAQQQRGLTYEGPMPNFAEAIANPDGRVTRKRVAEGTIVSDVQEHARLDKEIYEKFVEFCDWDAESGDE